MVFYVRRRFFEALVVKCFKNVLLPRAVQELDRLGTNTLNPTHTTPAAQQVTAALRRSPPPRYGAAAGQGPSRGAYVLLKTWAVYRVTAISTEIESHFG